MSDIGGGFNRSFAGLLVDHPVGSPQIDWGPLIGAEMIDGMTDASAMPSLLFSEHALGIGAWDVRGDPRGRIGRVADELQGVPMLDSLSIVVEPVAIDTADPRAGSSFSKNIQ